MMRLAPVWPGVHSMPMRTPTFPIRWSWEAWHGAYGDPWARGWKPWPWEPAPFQPRPGAAPPAWADILALYHQINDRRLT